MNKIVYRESDDLMFEYVTYIDGLSMKMDGGKLMSRELVKFEPQLMPSGNFELQAVFEWVEITGPWSLDNSDREIGVYEVITEQNG